MFFELLKLNFYLDMFLILLSLELLLKKSFFIRFWAKNLHTAIFFVSLHLH